jgi:F-type H+-transporting ATPase subunit epsilon
MVANNSFRCIVITPERQALDAEVSQVTVPAHDGEIGILPGHAPLLANLGVGLLKYQDTSGTDHFLFIDGGFCHVLNNEVTLLTSGAIAKDEITADEASSALSDAEALPRENLDEINKRSAAIRRAQSLVALSERH